MWPASLVMGWCIFRLIVIKKKKSSLFILVVHLYLTRVTSRVKFILFKSRFVRLLHVEVQALDSI